MRKSIAFLITLILCAWQAQATVIYVNLNAIGNNDGASWSNGYTNFQAAVDAAIAGDSIFVATAVYQPASGASFIMKEGVKIFGGFTGTESAFSQRSLKNKATLKGNGNSVVSNDDNGLTSAAELDGFIITGGTADQGGGIYNNKVSPVIRNCIFENNSANINGGGMFNATSSANIINCIFTGNTTAGNGGGLFNYTNAKVHIINCIIWGNNSDNSGGGIYNRLANPVITNTIIWNNMATLGDNGLFNNNGNPVFSYCNTQDQVWSGAGNISQDPLFTDPANGDFSLQNLSPCINTGNSAANNSAVDLAGNPRIMGTSIDMGAIERSPVKYVNLNATGNNDGSSWSNAYTDFQAAINAAIAGDSIFVTTAVYQPAAGASFVMKEGVKIFGGFTGTESSFSQRSLKNKATLKGNGNSVVSNDENGLTSGAELDGFIITGGNANQGGGIYNKNVSPIIRNCIFENNSATSYGGGMYNGGGSTPTVINCIFTRNTSAGIGGGINNSESSVHIINCIIWGNHSANGGGGIYTVGSNPAITNTIIWNNTATKSANGLYNGNAGRPVISYCNIQDQVLSGAGNISQDPLFTDPANGDFSLQNFSPCINTGNSAANSSGVDLAGNPRIMGPSIDMGP
ncbi:hypothetical protein FSB73_03350 [Arachidicoccus ginsenosidivorans]|uniref:DUF1565 domain-containing protein n=1 Tax=Arachidicoccus ginsenosidivorans TaxID=496057 RepID=A0A5B8VKS4_9BACT|nr:choice-of-anchor Q domain-containing protein [Arachidicoccus ginsenosidivorans]QEC70858.1 hypothetical protein FSB73_03350 [Arachidicoccus ginsenosidivorans]